MWRLKIGGKLTGYTVRPSEKWPGLWRVHAPDGLMSPLVNLIKAKDAALVWARPKGLRRTEIATWDIA